MEDGMPSVEERLANLEGRVNEQSNLFAVLRDSVSSVEQHLAQFEHRVDTRFDSVDRRFDSIDRRLETVESKLSHNLLWTVGIQVSTLVLVIGAIVAILTRSP
jgi:tetrahydromethanopterin S-methyltransferase subunit G